MSDGMSLVSMGREPARLATDTRIMYRQGRTTGKVMNGGESAESPVCVRHSSYNWRHGVERHSNVSSYCQDGEKILIVYAPECEL